MKQSTNFSQRHRIDHLAFATLDLAEGIEYVEDLFGVSVQPGGKHLAWGTHNVLLALGPDVFLEIIAPDPERSDPALPPLFGIDQLSEPRLAAWAVKDDRLDERLAQLDRAGISFGRKLAGHRRKPDGEMLHWQLTDPLTRVGEGVVPFLIDWGETPHPASAMPQDCTLLDLRIEHPDPERIAEIFRVLELDGLSVSEGSEAGLVARVRTPRGVVELG